MKTCPYCIKVLPFFNTVRQRLTFSESTPLICGSCNSIISVQGGASMWPSLAIGSTGGYLLGKFLGGVSIKIIVISVIFALVLFIVSSYFTAPVRNA